VAAIQCAGLRGGAPGELSLAPVGLTFEARKSFLGGCSSPSKSRSRWCCTSRRVGGDRSKAVDALTPPIQPAVEAELVHVERVEATGLVRAVEERPGMRSSSNPGPALFAHQTRRPARAATTEAGKEVVTDRKLESRVEGLSPRTRRRAGPGSAVEARQGVVTLEGPTSVDQVVQVAGGVPWRSRS
jgi:hypothetical protein